MASPAQEPIPKAPGLARLEALTRIGALVIGSVYVAGFIIVTLYHAEFGVGEISVFKARVLSAGILFALLTAFPVMLAAQTFGFGGFSGYGRFVVETEQGKERAGGAFAVLGMYVPCLGIALLTRALFQDEQLVPSIPIILLMSAALVSLVPISRMMKKHSIIRVILYVLATAVICWCAYKTMGRSLVLRSVWFYSCAVVARVIHPFFGQPIMLKAFTEWESWIVGLLALVSFFATTLYGHVQFRYGGGAAVPIRLYLSGDAPTLFAPVPTPAWLLEETDAGFYILRAPKDVSSLFIPRSSVRALEFNVQPNAKQDSSSKSPTKPPASDEPWLRSF